MVLILFLGLLLAIGAIVGSVHLIVYGSTHAADHPGRSLACILCGVFVIGLISTASVGICLEEGPDLMARINRHEMLALRN
ncbi:MAG TPA: hypothetical protein VF438_03530 [Candidatus Paceibacterota bacterium]